MSSQTLVMPCPHCEGAIVATLYREEIDGAGNRIQHFERGCVTVSDPPCEGYRHARDDGAWAFMELIVAAHSRMRDEMAVSVRGVLGWEDPTNG